MSSEEEEDNQHGLAVTERDYNYIHLARDLLSRDILKINHGNWFTLRISGSTVLVGTGALALYKIIQQRPEILPELALKVAPFFGQVVSRITNSSIEMEILTQDQTATQDFLEDYTSGNLLQRLKDFAEKFEDKKISFRIDSVEVVAIGRFEEIPDFTQINEEVEQKMKKVSKSSSLDSNEIIFYQRDNKRQIKVTESVSTNLKEYEASLEDKAAKQEKRSVLSGGDDDEKIAEVLRKVGMYLLKKKEYHWAVECLKQLVLLRVRMSPDCKSDEGTAVLYNMIGRCLQQMQEHDKSLKFLETSLKIRQDLSSNETADKSIIADISEEIADSLMAMQRYDNALEHLETSHKIRLQISSNVETDKEVANILGSIGNCLSKMQKHEKALDYLKRSLEIYKRVPPQTIDVFRALSSIGIQLQCQKKYGDALEYFHEALKCIQPVLHNEDTIDLAQIFERIGTCLCYRNRYSESLERFEESLKIIKNMFINQGNSGNGTPIAMRIDRCMQCMQKSRDCMGKFKESQKIEQVFSDEYGGVQPYNKLLKNLQIALTIVDEFCKDEDADRNVNFIFRNIATSLKHIQQISRSKAWDYLRNALSKKYSKTFHHE